ncbi:WG repeat-containing protein [Chryseobacterium sp.]|uniref:WG repeat-containing protein n=1 Tax=Chryseobacterium sp. TaxID=1871047 RepID=UPI0028970B05|nr:WG repeat-containing protein [Chryseobacterium sp.]
MTKNLPLLLFLLSFTSNFSQSKIEGSYDKANKMFIQKNRNFWISEFTNGVAKISKDGYYGIINESGNYILPVIYDEIFLTNEGIFAKKEMDKFAFNYDGSTNCNTFFGVNANKDSYQEYPAYKILNFDMYGKPFSEGLFVSKQYYNSENNKYQLTYFDEFGNVKLTSDKYFSGNIFSEGLASVSYFKYWGFIDKTGKEVISPKYDYETYFREGVANVSKNGKSGLIDSQENVIIPFDYELISPAFDGMVSVKKGEKFGYFDLKGKQILDFVYDDALIFNNGYAQVRQDGKWFSINKKGESSDYYQFPFEEGYRFMDYNGNKVYEDKSGTVVFKNTLNIQRFKEGVSVIQEKGKFGFADRMGNITIKPIYDSAEDFKDGFARVRTGNDNFYIDKKGNRTEPKKPSKQSFNIKGISVLKQDNIYSISNCNTKKVIEKDIQELSIKGNFIVITKNNKKTLLDFAGNSVLKNIYEELIFKKDKIIGKLGNSIEIFDKSLKLEKKLSLNDSNFSISDEKKSDNAILIEQNSKKGLINIDDLKMMSPRFESLTFLEKSGLFLGKYSNENYLIDVSKNIATLFTYDHYEEFSKGIIKTSKYGKNQGLIDSENNIILAPEFEISFLSNNTAIIKKNNLYGLINDKGKIIMEPKYQKISYNDGAYINGDDELILVKLNNKIGFVDRNGNMKIDFQYEDVTSFNNKLAPVKLNGKWGYIDKFNTMVIKNIYDEAWPFIDIYQARAKIGSQYMIIDRNGKKIRNTE